MNFLFDNNLAPKLARGLNALVEPEHKIVHLKDRFAPNVEDEEWMKTLAQEQCWVIITADVRIRRNPHEVRAWKEAGHTVFFLKPGWTDLTFWEQANKFTKSFPDIISTAERAKLGAGFLVSVNGKIEELR
ncbi:MAG: DUF5615 family PIN-like protein [Verrucomicrobia bacterium]|nr:DUF5615 family PIN-like protein [Verrucomicrobiota bacterium]